MVVSSVTPDRTGPVVDCTGSPYAALRPAPLGAVRLEDAFWAPRLAVNRDVTLPAQLQHCEATGRIDNFRRAAGKRQGDFQGIFFNDSDVYKLLEAMAYSLATHPDPKLEADVDAVIAEIAAAQDADGYLDTYFTFERASERFTNLKDMHEIYCAGHLIQAAVAHHRATGKTTLLEVAVRLADHLDAQFGPGGRPGACGHEEAEMGLVELYRDTGEPRYLELARRMVEARGRKPGLFGNGSYHQDHLPFVEQTEMVGHAVRHVYLNCGAADVCLELGDAGYRHALETLWDDLTQRKMYITGGAGARYEGEAFGAAYELPNDRAYAETCAAIGSVMWSWRMLHLTGESKYADLMETTLYNGILSGLSLDGANYFYQNPLADRGRHRRQPWFGCACCPPNVARMLASLPGYFYSTVDAGVYVHLYAAGSATLSPPSGGTIAIRQRSDYPWSGDIEIEALATGGPTALFLRIPWWAEGATLEVDGQLLIDDDAPAAGSYARAPLAEGRTTQIRLRLPMRIAREMSHPHVLANRDRVALRRGPIVYCLEQADHPDADVWDLALPADATLTSEHRRDLLGGVTVLEGTAIVHDSAEWDGALYAPFRPAARTSRSVALTAIPYYAWANREAGPMQVWIPRKR